MLIIITTNCLVFGLCTYNKTHLKVLAIEKWSQTEDWKNSLPEIFLYMGIKKICS